MNLTTFLEGLIKVLAGFFGKRKLRYNFLKKTSIFSCNSNRNSLVNVIWSPFLLNRQIQLKKNSLISFRCVHTFAPGKRPDFSNALRDVSDNPSDELADQIGVLFYNHITSGIENNIPLSQIIRNAPYATGYYIHPNSFFSCLEALRLQVERQGYNFNNILYNLDDLHFYRPNDLGVFVLRDDQKGLESCRLYFDYIDSVINLDFPLMNSSAPLEETRILPNNDVSSSNTSSSTNTDESISDDFVSTNNSEILVYTILAFLTIVTIAYLTKKYNKKEEIVHETNPAETDISDMTSIYEPIFSVKTLTNILLLFLPAFLFIFFTLRYYYFYRVYFWIKARIHN